MIDYFYQLDYNDRVPDLKTTDPSVVPPSISGVATASMTKPKQDHKPSMYASDVPNTALPSLSSMDKDRMGGISWQGRTSNMSDPGTEVQMETLTVNALMYALADKYNIDGLKALAREKFANETAVIQDPGAFVRAAELVSSTTASSDQGLRKLVSDTIFNSRHLIQHKQVRNLLNSGNGFAWKLLRRSWKG